MSDELMKKKMEPVEFLTPKDVSNLLNRPKIMLLYWGMRGKLLSVYKKGHGMVYKRECVENFINERNRRRIK